MNSALHRWASLGMIGTLYSGGKAPATLDEAEDISRRYREGATDLARVRAYSPDRHLGRHLGQIVAQAHFATYRKQRPGVMTIARSFIFGFPELIRRFWRYHIASVLLVALGFCIGFFAVDANPEHFYLFVDRELAAGRDPYASHETLAESLNKQSDVEEGMAFSMFLWQHNTRVAFLTFAGAILLGLPTVYMLLITGMMLGAMHWVFVDKALGVEFMAWILPHGVPEIGAIMLCGGAALAIGHRTLNPGNRPRRQALVETARESTLVALGAAPLLFLAGLIEGVFRQSGASIEMRYGLFIFMLVLMLTWLILTRGKWGRDQWARDAAYGAAS